MKIVKITWVDSSSFNYGWTERDDLPNAPLGITTVGFLVKKTRDYYMISHSIGLSDCYNPYIIPKGCVEKIEYI